MVMGQRLVKPTADHPLAPFAFASCHMVIGGVTSAIADLI
jgi:hypothetical protein